MTRWIAKSAMSTKSDLGYQLISLCMWNFAFRFLLYFWAIAFCFCWLWHRFTEVGNDPHKLIIIGDFVDGIMEMMIS